MDRREFLRVTTLASGALVFGVNFAACSSEKKLRRREMTAVAEQTGNFSPNAFITITPDDRILVAVEKSEMGQGILTSHAMLVAEELDVPLDRVEASSADGAPEYQTSFGMQITGGSTSTRESFFPIRRAAASARQMLLEGAAARWGVPVTAVTVAAGVVSHAESGRSARYGELLADAVRQPIPESAALKSPEDFAIIGTSATRVEAAAKVTGRAVFGIDVVVPGMVKATIVRPPVMGAEPLSFDPGSAASMPGVVDIVMFPRGVAVLAEKYWQAVRAAREIRVVWSESPLDGVSTEDIRSIAREKLPGGGTVVRKEGDVDKALKRDDVTVLRAVYEVPYLAHATMEPMNCTAHVRDGEVEVWAPTQGPTVIQEVGAQICGVDRDAVTVHVTLLGGGFGRRGTPDFAAEAIELSRRTGRPVQVVWSREDDTGGGYYRPYALNEMTGAVDASGNVVAWRYHSVSPSITTVMTNWAGSIFPEWMPTVARKVMARNLGGLMRSGTVPEFISVEGARHPSYRVPNQRIEFTPLQAAIQTCFWRSVGHSYNGFVVESFVDELANAVGEDPVAFRRRQIEDERLRAVLDRVVQMSKWGTPLEDGWARGVAVHPSFDSYCAQVAEVKLDGSEIRVRKVYCAIDCGRVVNPDIVAANMESSIIFGLSAALYQKVTLRDGRVEQGNFDDYPLLRMHECPDIEVSIVESTAPPTGVGEPGLPPIAPAVANALFAATGKRLRTMPFYDALRDEETP